MSDPTPVLLRALLVGCGSISRHGWLKAIQLDLGIELVGCVDVNRESALDYAQKAGLPESAVFTDQKEAIDALQPEAVFDCTPPAFHPQVAEIALTNGCHLLSEKPLAEDLDAARRTIELAEKHDRILAVIQNRRALTGMNEIRTALQSGRIGQLGAVSCDFFRGPRFGGFREEMEHVLLVDMAIHTFDMLRFLTGENATGVFCREFNPPYSWFRHGASAVATFDLTSGAVYDYRGSWCASYANTEWEATWRFEGGKGTLLWNPDGLFLESGDPKNPSREALPVTKLSPREDGHAANLIAFRQAVLGKGTPLVTGRDHFGSLAMVRGAVTSAESGRYEEVPAS